MKSFFVFLLFLSGPCTVVFSADCPRLADKTPCKGECGSFIDKNKNGICDAWERDSALAETEKKSVPVKNSTDVVPLSAPKKETLLEKLNKFGFPFLFLACFFAIIAAEFLKRKSGIYKKVHGDIWNWLLFLSFLTCGVTGFFLYFGFFHSVKDFLFKLHLWSGAISFFSSFYHFAERYGRVFPFKKTE